MLHRDWFPLTMCPAGKVTGSPAIALQESGVPWFVDLKDIIEGGSGSHEELEAAIRERAASCAKKGATALILYNSSARQSDRLEFDPKEHPEPAAIPVVYVTREAKKKFLRDESASVDISLRVSYTEKEESGNNVVALLDNAAQTTVVIASRYDNCSGTAVMLELARLLGLSKLRNNNYLFLVFSGSGSFRPGSAWFAAHPTVDWKKLNYVLALDDLGSMNDATHQLTVRGISSSPAWTGVWAAIRDKQQPSFRYDSSAAARGDEAVFYRQHIPMLVFTTGAEASAGSAEAPINYPGELRVLKFIYALIESANNRGRITPAP